MAELVQGSEQIGREMLDFIKQLRNMTMQAQDLFDRYWDSGMATQVNNLATDTTVVPGSLPPMTKAQMISAITLITDLKNFANNAAVTTAARRANLNLLNVIK